MTELSPERLATIWRLFITDTDLSIENRTTEAFTDLQDHIAALDDRIATLETGLEVIADTKFDPKTSRLWPSRWAEWAEDFFRLLHSRAWNGGFWAGCSDCARIANYALGRDAAP